MSEETNVPESNGTWSGLKKTIIGVMSTAVLGVGGWATNHFMGGGEEHKTEQAATAPVINVNLENNNTNQQKQTGGGTTTIIKEKTVEKAAPAEKEKPAKKSETKDSPW